MKKSKIKKILILLIFIVLIISLIVIGTKIDKSVKHGDYEGEDSSNLKYNGVNYTRKTGLSSILLIGLDHDGSIVSSDSNENDYRSDFIAVLSVDDINKTYSILQLNRDTMLQVQQLDITGASTGIYRRLQLALSYTYGNGMDVSSINTKHSVSKLLNGLPIDNYATISLDAVKILNDYLGGVQVTMPNDYTDIDESFIKGATVRLDGEQAYDFVRSRKDVDDQTNISRMERHKIYTNAFIDAFSACELNDQFIKEGYDLIQDKKCILTNASINTISNMLNKLDDYKFEGIFTPEGTSKVVDGHMQFEIDYDSLTKIMIELYYTK